MSKFIKFSLQFGVLQYFPEVEDRPKTSKTTGNLTINSEAIKGVPAHFKCQHWITAKYENEGVDINTHFCWETAVIAPISTPYEKVENLAAQSIPSMLRTLADSLEKPNTEEIAN